MNIKKQKLILHFLKQLQEILGKENSDELSGVFRSFFDHQELIEILQHFYTSEDLQGQKIDTLGYKDLLELVGEDQVVLSFVIDKMEERISAVPKLEQEEVQRLFDQINLDSHYLRDKPVEEWDGYDTSNYYSILFKHGKIREVYAIFSSDIQPEDVYIVTTPPSQFFDTKEEAENELKNILAERKLSSEDLVIHPIWHLI